MRVTKPYDPTNPVTVPLEGEPIGRLVLGADGIAYQTTRTGTSGNYATHISVIDPADLNNPNTFDLDGEPVGRLVLDGGSIYQTTRTGASGNYTTHVSVIDTAGPAGTITYNMPGDPRGGVALDADGRLRQLSSATSPTTHLSFIDPSDPPGSTNPTTIDLPGAPWNEPSLLVGEGGTIYQTTYTFNGGYTSYISAINPSTPADFTTITVHDAAFNIRVAPDGHVYHTTQDYHAELGDYVTHVTVIDFNDPANPAPPVEIPGYPESSGVVLGPMHRISNHPVRKRRKSHHPCDGDRPRRSRSRRDAPYSGRNLWLRWPADRR